MSDGGRVREKLLRQIDEAIARLDRKRFAAGDDPELKPEIVGREKEGAEPENLNEP